MGKAGSRLTQALGFGGNPAGNENGDPSAPRPPQWDTTIDELFGDAPGDDNVIAPPVLDPPIPSRGRRRRPPPPPPSIMGRGRRRPGPLSPAARRRRPRGNKQPMCASIVPEIPRRVASGAVRAINTPLSVNRRSVAPSAPLLEREMPIRGALTSNFKRRPASIRRRRPSSQRTQRLQELLQCPVCLTSYIEPRLLPCGHTYCDECLQRLLQDDSDIVTCPECRKQHIVPDDGIFPSNFVVRNLLEEQGLANHSRLGTSANLPFNSSPTAKCTTCETFAPLRLCRHCNFMVCDRCLRAHRLDSNEDKNFSKRSSKSIQFYVAVRKVTRTESQVKRLTIDMPMGNYLRDSSQTLIERIAQREQLQSVLPDLVLEFGDKRLRPQRTLASYGVQTGDLLFLFSPEQRLNFLGYDEDNSHLTAVNPRETSRLRTNSYNSSLSDVRTATTTTSNDLLSNRRQPILSPISDHAESLSSYSSRS